MKYNIWESKLLTRRGHLKYLEQLKNLNIETFRVSSDEVINNLNKMKYDINKAIEARKVSFFKGKARRERV